MASSDNLASYEPWSFRSSFPESWISEAYARDTHTLTRALALTSTISTTTDSNSTATCSVSPDSLTSSDGLCFNPFFSFLNPEITPITTTTTATATTTTPTTTNPSTSTASNVSGSDPESAPKRQRNSLPGPTGKVSKRKSRATKKSQTTFITADPADFRRMVQQVTGVRFGSNSQMPVVSVLKPEAQRPCSRFQGSSGASGCLPTLDTSAFLLDHQQQQPQPQQVVMMASGSGPGPVGPGSVSFSQPMVGGGGLDFDSLSCFPTLESFM